MTFKQALENLKQAGQELNSAYYMENLDKRYPITDPDDKEDLWHQIKIAESIGREIEEWIEYMEANPDDYINVKDYRDEDGVSYGHKNKV
jgi:hypothetical protein